MVQQVKKISSFGATANRFDNVLYDTLNLEPGTESYQFFTTPRSNAKPEGFTNMSPGGQLAEGIDFIVAAIGLRIFCLEQQTTDWFRLLNNAMSTATATFNMTGKQDLGLWPLSMWLDTINSGVTPITAGDGDQITTQGSSLNWVALNRPIAIASKVQFDMDLKFYESLPAGLTGPDVENPITRIKLILRGTMYRKK